MTPPHTHTFMNEFKILMQYWDCLSGRLFVQEVMNYDELSVLKLQHLFSSQRAGPLCEPSQVCLYKCLITLAVNLHCSYTVGQVLTSSSQQRRAARKAEQ